MIKRLAALLVLTALTPAQATTVTYCPVEVWRDYTFGITYRALLFPDPACEGVTRVRKASMLNRYGPYRPIKPDGSQQYGGLWGWTVEGVPTRELWTSFSWQWNYWDGTHWVPVMPQ